MFFHKRAKRCPMCKRPPVIEEPAFTTFTTVRCNNPACVNNHVSFGTSVRKAATAWNEWCKGVK